jgi:hypothetical protein
LPQGVFNDEFFQQHPNINIDIHDKEFGWMLEKVDHTGKGGIHPDWNTDWKNWLERQQGSISKEDILQQLQVMKEKYGSILSKGKPATMSHKSWLNYLARMRNAAKKLPTWLGEFRIVTLDELKYMLDKLHTWEPSDKDRQFIEEIMEEMRKRDQPFGPLP